MRSLPRLVPLLIAAASLIGCDAAVDEFNKVRNQGTTLGYHNCLQENEGLSISKSSVVSLCRSKHEGRHRVTIGGTAGYHCDDGYGCWFGGYIKNESKDVVVTELKISVMHEDNKDSSGKPQVEVLDFKNLWIEPGFTEKIEIGGLEFQPEKDRLFSGKTYFYQWQATETRGIKVKLK